MKNFLFPLILILATSAQLWAQSTPVEFHAQAKLNCNECHFCKQPTYKNPCLKLFPDFKREGLTIYNTADQAPELFTIDTLLNIYEPSVFTHKLHAEMSAMSGGCASCHHNNPPGKILSCIKCHDANPQSDLKVPGLKGAYHRQCLNCHREWSHTTNCTVCHAEKGTKNISDKSEFVGKSHEKMVIPTKLVYETGNDDNPIVTFYHNEHNNVFNLQCADCHKNESCSRCHDKSEKQAKAQIDVHENCSNCHDTEDDNLCNKCHDTKEKPAFNHASYGWTLNVYHESLKCRECHGESGFKKLNNSCISCHKSWLDGDFDHGVTGLVLDENHSENECTDCHSNLKFDQKPGCSDCHDGYSYPAKKPGKQLRR